MKRLHVLDVLRGIALLGMFLVHFSYSSSGGGWLDHAYETVVTHLFVEGDPYLESDAVFGVKNSLVIDFRRNASEADAKKLGLKAPFREASYDFVLKTATTAAKQQKVTSAADAA